MTRARAERVPRRARASALVYVVVLSALVAVVLMAILTYSKNRLRLTSRSLAEAKARYAAEAGVYCMLAEIRYNPQGAFLAPGQADQTSPLGVRITGSGSPSYTFFHRGGSTVEPTSSLVLSNEGGALAGQFDDGTEFHVTAAIVPRANDPARPAMDQSAGNIRIRSVGHARWGMAEHTSEETLSVPGAPTGAGATGPPPGLPPGTPGLSPAPGPQETPGSQGLEVLARVERIDSMFYDGDWLNLAGLVSAQQHDAVSGYTGGDPNTIRYASLYGRRGIVLAAPTRPSPELYFIKVAELSTGEEGLLVAGDEDQGRLHLGLADDAGGDFPPSSTDFVNYLTFATSSSPGLGAWRDFTTWTDAKADHDRWAHRWVDDQDRYTPPGAAQSLLRAHTFHNGRDLVAPPLAMARAFYHGLARTRIEHGDTTYRPLGYPSTYQWPDAKVIDFDHDPSPYPFDPGQPTVIFSRVPLIVRGSPPRDTILFSDGDILIAGTLNADTAKYPVLSSFQTRDLTDYRGSSLSRAVHLLGTGTLEDPGNVWLENAAARLEKPDARRGKYWHSVDVISGRRVWIDDSDPRTFARDAAVGYLTFEITAWLLGRRDDPIGDDPPPSHWRPMALLAAYERAAGPGMAAGSGAAAGGTAPPGTGDVAASGPGTIDLSPGKTVQSLADPQLAYPAFDDTIAAGLASAASSGPGTGSGTGSGSGPGSGAGAPASPGPASSHGTAGGGSGGDGTGGSGSAGNPTATVDPLQVSSAWVDQYRKTYRVPIDAATLRREHVTEDGKLDLGRLRALIASTIFTADDARAAGPMRPSLEAMLLGADPQPSYDPPGIPALATPFYRTGLLTRMYRTAGRIYARRKAGDDSRLYWAMSDLPFHTRFFSPFMEPGVMSDAYANPDAGAATARATVASGSVGAGTGTGAGSGSGGGGGADNASGSPAATVPPEARVTNAYFAFPWWTGPAGRRTDALGASYGTSRLVWPQMTINANLVDYLRPIYHDGEDPAAPAHAITRWVEPGAQATGSAAPRMNGCCPPQDGDPGTSPDPAQNQAGLVLRSELGNACRNDWGQPYPGATPFLYAFEGDVLLRLVGSETHACEYPRTTHADPAMRAYSPRDVPNVVPHRAPTTKRVFDPTVLMLPGLLGGPTIAHDKLVLISVRAWQR